MKRIILSILILTFASSAFAQQQPQFHYRKRVSRIANGNGITPPPPPPPPTNPICSFTSPTAGTSFQTSASFLVVSGGCSGDVSGGVTLTNTAASFTGTAVGNNSWSYSVAVASNVANDSFTGSSNITAHTPESGGSWLTYGSDLTAVNYIRVFSVEVQPNGSGTNQHEVSILNLPTPLSGNQYRIRTNLAHSSTSGFFWSAGSLDAAAIIFGWDTSLNDFQNYCAVVMRGAAAATDLELVSVASGIKTIVASGNFGAVAGDEIRLDADGNDFTVYINDVQKLTGTSANCAAHSGLGIGFGALSTSATDRILGTTRLDNFSVVDLGAGAAGVPLATGANSIVASGCDLSAHCGTVTLVVTKTGTDTLPPTFNNILPVASSTNVTTTAQTITGDSSDNFGVTSVTGSCTNSATISIQGTIHFSAAVTIVNTGTSTCTVVAHDAAGLTTSIQRSFLYSTGDSTPPTISVTSPTNGSTTSSSSITFVGTMADAGSGPDYVSCANSNGNTVRTSGTIVSNWSVVTSLSGGVNSVVCTAYDIAGNHTDASAITVTLNVPLAWQTSATLPNVINGAAYSQSLTAQGGVLPYVYTEVGSNLNTGNCAGITLTAGSPSATLSGTATAIAGSVCSATIRVTDNASTVVDRTFTFTVTSNSLGGQNQTYFNTMIGWPAAHSDGSSIVGSWTLKSRTQLFGTINQSCRTEPQCHAFIDYDPTNDTHPHRQDAAKIMLPAFSHQSQISTNAATYYLTTGVIDAANQGDLVFIPVTANLPNASHCVRGVAFKIDSEIMINSGNVTGNTCKVLRGAFNTAAVSHVSGSYVFINTNNPIVSALQFPVHTNTVAGRKTLLSLDWYWTDDWQYQSEPASTAGVYGNICCPTTNIAGFKWFNILTSGASIWGEPQIDFGGGLSFEKPTSFNAQTDLATMNMRAYGVTGQPYYGKDDIYYKDNMPILQANRWIRIWLEVEENTLTSNMVDYGNANLAVAMDNQSTSTQLIFNAPTPIAPLGAAVSHESFFTGFMIGRRVKIGNELMSVQSCIGSEPQVNPGTRTCTVTRATDGTAIESHSVSDQLKVTWDYVSMWVADEVQEPVRMYTRIPMHFYTFGSTPDAWTAFWIEMNTSTAPLMQHVASHNFLTMAAYTRNLWIMDNPPSDWNTTQAATFLVKPTVGGN